MALAGLPLVGPAAAQTFVDVQRETTATSGVFTSPVSIRAYEAPALTPAQYYNYGAVETFSYSGPAITFTLPAVRYVDLLEDGINIFFVNTSAGLTLFWVAGKMSQAGTTLTATHVGRRGAVQNPLAVLDDAGDTYTYTSGNTVLTTTFTVNAAKTDGFAALLPAGFVFDTEIVTAPTRITTWRVHRPGTAPIDYAVEPGRALRFGPRGLRIADVTNVYNGPGWRLLSAPVRGVTVDSLAAQNLVQGVPGAGATPGQYPLAQPNLFVGYNGGGRYDYVPAPTTASALVPGRGLWWYWYDLDIDPPDTAAGGGTSESRELTGFTLRATGAAVQDTTLAYADNVNTASNSGLPTANPDPTTAGAPAGTVSPADDNFYLVGNPYRRPFSVTAMTVTGGTLADAAFIWNPGNPGGTPPVGGPSAQDGPGSYEVVFRTPPDLVADSIAVWQGLMAEVTPATVGGTVAFAFAVAGSRGTGRPPFYGRAVPEPYLHLSLAGVTASGAHVRDAAAYVRFRSDADTGWDAFDASKPIPPSASYALVAPVGLRDGEPVLQAVRSLPEGSAEAVSVALATSEAGTYTLTWEGTAPGVTLTDNVTGASVALDTATEFTFEAGATAWAERFTLSFGSAVAGAPAPDGDGFVGLPTPNPATGTVRLAVQVVRDGTVDVSVHDALGRRVRHLAVALAAGTAQTLEVPTDGLAPGAYVVRIEAPGLRETRRLTIVR